ncbi:30S ribosomal protein S14 [Desulfurococcus mucosus]|uniref:Small ribosomal subunit protein uS14 n=1 Tax=Desulfurococcus mucosus (strain ATCC 35584 / DSM 2162 / JCM 9187 / O7/1) TaxID=765177 RepID=E8RAM6_DESM0|nr:30S ribosomal protein S14 [Desulfurococcus mucosus]ADV65462.1 SSU ribosomal protein S14P [Desulfurococcus mucosus DSM 2162]
MAKIKQPKTYKYGRGTQVCRRCGSRDAVIQAYGLYLCRQCFREVAAVIGFKKYE